MKYDIYKDISLRTNGDIYIGVVGPVRTGKSTFITQFIKELVIPNIDDKLSRGIAVDEMPQSASGNSVMTTEPKFVPSQAVGVKFGKCSANVRLIDCVGFMVDGAEGDKNRLVKTPWQDNPMPFDKAAEIGTRKVMREHSTIGIVMTSDGSFTDIKRESYQEQEIKVINELKEINKPFIVLYNCKNPDDEIVKSTCVDLEKSYGVGVIPINALELNKESISQIMGAIINEFSIKSFNIDMPKWMGTLPYNSPMIADIIDKLKDRLKGEIKLKDSNIFDSIFDDSDIFEPIQNSQIDMGKGSIYAKLVAKDGVFYKAISQATNENIENDLDLMNYVKELCEAKKNYQKMKSAIECCEQMGYGIVSPESECQEIESPTVVKKGGQYAVKMRVKSKSLHLIRADLERDIYPVYGSKNQCENFIDMINSEDGYQTEIFGKPLKHIVDEEMSNSSTLNDNLKLKLKKTITKAVNDKKNGMICILI